MSRYCPLFVNLVGRRVVVYGAGSIGSRRILSLLEFGCSLTVVAPEASGEVKKLSEESKLLWDQAEYRPGSIPEDACLVLATTSSREVNAQIGAECKRKQIPVNISSDKSLCDFYFPGLAIKGDLVAGVTAGGEDHRRARKAAEEIRCMFKKKT